MKILIYNTHVIFHYFHRSFNSAEKLTGAKLAARTTNPTPKNTIKQPRFGNERIPNCDYKLKRPEHGNTRIWVGALQLHLIKRQRPCQRSIIVRGTAGMWPGRQSVFIGAAVATTITTEAIATIGSNVPEGSNDSDAPLAPAIKLTETI